MARLLSVGIPTLIGLVFIGGLLAGPWMNHNGWNEFLTFFSGLGELRFDQEFISLLIHACVTTLAIAIVATIGTVGLGCVFGICASQRSLSAICGLPLSHWFPRLLFYGTRTILVIPRALHELVWALIFVIAIGLDPLAAIAALILPFSAMTAKVFAEMMDEVDPAHADYLIQQGAHPLTAWAYGIVPKVMGECISYSFYRFECAIRGATVLGIVGIGGLGHQLYVSFQGRQYGEVWSFMIALIILNIFAEYISSLVRSRMRRGQLYHEIQPQKRIINNSWLTSRTALFLITCVSFVLSWFWLKPDLTRLAPETILRRSSRFFDQAWPPDFAILNLSGWLETTGITMLMSILGMLIAGFFSAVAVVATVRCIMQPTAHKGAQKGAQAPRAILLVIRFVLLVGRAIPAPIWALLVCFIVFPGAIAGAIALGLYTAGVLGRLGAEVIENADRESIQDAARSGGGAIAVTAFAVIPQHRGQFTSYFFYRTEETIRISVAIGLVAAGGMGELLQEQRATLYFPGLSAVLIAYIAVVGCVDCVSYIARRRMTKS